MSNGKHNAGIVISTTMAVWFVGLMAAIWILPNLLEWLVWLLDLIDLDN